MAKTLQEVLDTELSPEKVKEWTVTDLADYLITNGIVTSAGDYNCMVIEAIQKALKDDDEFPIHYYSKEEPMSEKGREVADIQCLTDEYIENNMQ